MTQSGSSGYTVSDYLFDRLAEIGINHIFGVPGDFNLKFLDTVTAHDRLTWVGNCNELNAGYCADGYARLKGAAAMVTTFGVGELSAINATGGSYAEYVPVLHIVGAPVTEILTSRKKIHHSLGDGVFTHFYEMAGHVTCAQAWLTPSNATSEIDRVITEMLAQRRPAYLVLSPDVAAAEVYPSDEPLEIDIARKRSSSAALKAFERAATEFLDGHSATVLGDLLVHRVGCIGNFDRMINANDLPYATLTWGKTLVDERSDRFAGIYIGAASSPRAKDAVENAERLITIGVEFTDSTTAGFSMNLGVERVLDISPTQSTIGGRTFAPLQMGDAIDALARILADTEVTPHELKERHVPAAPHSDPNEPLTQNVLWSKVSEWLPEDSLVIADQGTSFFGMADSPLPFGVSFIGQSLWASIGYSIPAALGAGMANRDRRMVVLVGDGSAQLTVQEIATMFREGINPLIILVNNSGYTIERAIHGPDEVYNDITPFNWQDIPRAFGGNEDNCLVIDAPTPATLDAALEQADRNRDKLVMIEVHTDRDDYPQMMRNFTETLGRKD
ncbi:MULTISPECIES: alpha-keto acid decarboxylase family protein [unclassified Corynebacterium]|uniref:alpha-keto acid decarboxylase family protein n=1 Tax=unclassified Corynebacterium TaxID=2624378 RepID=UPI003524E6B1